MYLKKVENCEFMVTEAMADPTDSSDMTAVACGGGPSLDQRRGFAGLKDGAHVPGYRGYIPQLKYRPGKTYGDETFDLSREYPSNGLTASIHPSMQGRPLNLPDSTGDNKYTSNMVPGYTGYIPRLPFKYGQTYKEDCDYCIDEHMNNLGKYYTKEGDLKRSLTSHPRLHPIQGDPVVRDRLNTISDGNPARIMLGSKRGPTEPPIPGYKGYVPRIYTTEKGLGCRYNQMSRNGLDLFKYEQDFGKAIKSAPVTINRDTSRVGRSEPAYSRRLYLPDGMIPKYTGYVPQRRFNFGNTYGDTTRSLEVCGHNQNHFGEYMDTKPFGLTSSLA